MTNCRQTHGTVSKSHTPTTRKIKKSKATKLLQNIACYDMILDLAADVHVSAGLKLLSLYVLPFLKIAVTLEVFQSLGTIQVSKLFSKIMARCGEKNLF